MKKYILITLTFLLTFSCTKDDDILIKKSLTEAYSLSTTDGSSSSGPSDPEGGSEIPGNGQYKAGQITAAEWNDLKNWSFWNDLMQNQDYGSFPGYWSFDISQRISVEVKTPSGDPVSNLEINLIDESGNSLWTSRTDNFGNTELWFMREYFYQQDQNLRLRINSIVHDNIKLFHEEVNQITIADPMGSNNIAQVAFMIDATGSMSDELEYLKAELVDVLEEVRTSNPDAIISTASVFYRDEGDEYLVKDNGFTEDTYETISFIKDQKAEGGGDYPEAVHVALEKSVNNLQWSSNASTRLLFILLDAPPHAEAQVISQIVHLVKEAAAKGIKIIPITASGIDKETEFLMRCMAIATSGTYVFITDDSGIGHEHLEASVGQYEVEYLNDLLKRLINKYIP